jgi:HD-like signal output (HDOD) protein/CheY-like chemotaxis protein
MPTSVLFVDDDNRLLSGLRRMLWSQRDQWNMEFVSDGEAALNMLQKKRFDVIVSDMRMPGIDGAELLKRVRATQPDSVRIILSGHTEQEAILRSIGPAHQFLTKPCDSDHLRSTISRACALHSRIKNTVLKSMIAKITKLPTIPALYEKLVAELNSPNVSMDRISKIVASDIGMTTRLLQLVNSAFFGLPHRVSDPAHAVRLLGIDLIKCLVLSAGIFTNDSFPELAGFSMDSLVNHSLAVGTYAQTIARLEGCSPQTIDDALLSGMMHDIGKVLLGMSVPNIYESLIQRSQAPGVCLREEEEREFGVTHAEVGGFLLELWGLPHRVVEAVTFHHHPELADNSTFSPTLAVHVANSLEGGVYGEHLHDDTSLMNREYLEQLGLIERLPAWEQAIARILEGRRNE